MKTLLCAFLQFGIFLVAVSGQQQSTTISDGIRTERSVLIDRSNSFNQESFEWRGEFLISYYEVVVQNVRREQVLVEGGVGQMELRIRSRMPGQRLEMINVQIYAQPRDFTFGMRNASNDVIHTQRFTGPAPLLIEYAGQRIISAIELLGQSLDNGVFVQQQYGIGQRSLSIQLATFARSGPPHLLDYTVRVYGAPIRPTHGTVGRMQADSQLLATMPVRNADTLHRGVFQFIAEPTAEHQFQLDFVRFTDLSGGHGGMFHGASIHRTRLWAAFDSIVAVPLDYRVEIYGHAVRRPSTVGEITVGRPHPDDRIADVRYAVAFEPGTQRVALQMLAPIARIEVRNVASQGPVQVRLVEGLVGGRSVVVDFAVDGDEAIMYFMVVVYERPAADDVDGIIGAAELN